MTDTTRTAPLLLLGLLTAPVGCSSGAPVNIGDTQSLGAKLSDYAAEWDGYAEAYTFEPSSSDHIHMSLDAQGNGTIQVGNDPLLPAPTDPNVGFPPGMEATKELVGVTVTTLSGGVLYPVHAAQVQADRIQLGLKPLDYYAAWCAIQTPHYYLNGYVGSGGPDGGLVPNYMYGCVQGGGGSETFDSPPQCTVQDSSLDGSVTNYPVDCGKYHLCLSQVCSCTAASCTSSPTLPPDTAASAYPAELDGALDSSGKALTGTLNLNGTRVTVHLTRK